MRHGVNVCQKYGESKTSKNRLTFERDDAIISPHAEHGHVPAVEVLRFFVRNEPRRRQGEVCLILDLHHVMVLLRYKVHPVYRLVTVYSHVLCGQFNS